VWQLIAGLDGAITAEKPFLVVKEDPERGKLMIANMVEQVDVIQRLLQPFMPATAQKIEEAIKLNKKPDNLFPRKE
jgi:methionyl-tRNA synthetase